MHHYSPERKEAILQKMAPPHSLTVAELAKGIGSQMKQGFQERVNETTGGKMAASIRESMEPKEADHDGNSLGGTQGNDEVASFVNRETDNNEGGQIAAFCY